MAKAAEAFSENVVIVTDWITKVGGGEMVVEQLHKLYPNAPIYTSYCNSSWRKRLNNRVVTGYLQNWPFSTLRRFLPVLRQRWFGKLDLSKFDTIISITGNGEAKFVKSSKHQKHICYCHTPPHFYWAQYNEYIKHPSMRPYWLARLGLKLLVGPLRQRDYKAAQQVSSFIANSEAIKSDIKTFYQRDSQVVHPPVDYSKFVHISPRVKKRIIPDRPSCVWWGRIVPAKRLDIAVKACSELGIPLTIIGDGPDIPRLKQLAGPSVTFTGFVSDTERENYIKQADLFVFPAKEDFGVATVEALAAGLPVIAYKAGGALDYINQKNGRFFEEQTVESLVHALEQSSGAQFSTADITSSSEDFSVDNFKTKIKQIIQKSTGG